MTINNIIEVLETIAPPSLQEPYDNAGLITGNARWNCTGVLCSLDATEKVIDEAIAYKCNLIVAHHPILFSGLKKINGNNYVEKAIIKALKNDIALYAIHTNIDNIINGVNGKIADLLQLTNRQILLPKTNLLKKIYTFVPIEYIEHVKSAIFDAGGGNIGQYSECSFSVQGEGTFKAGNNTNPFVGTIGKHHTEKEIKVEIIFPAWLQNNIIKALQQAHPYEEVAYDIIELSNNYNKVGSGLIGDLTIPISEEQCLKMIKERFNLKLIRHSPLLNKPISKIAVCGGAGSFLVPKALAAGAQLFLTADMKYHEFFDANEQMIIADIGHYESEQFTKDLLVDILKDKFPTFAVLKSETITNPVQYYI